MCHQEQNQKEQQQHYWHHLRQPMVQGRMQIEAAEVVVVHGGDLLQLATAAAAGLNIVVITAMMSMLMLLCNVVQFLLGDGRTLAFERCQHELCFVEQSAGLHVVTQVPVRPDVRQRLIDLGHVPGERADDRGQPVECGHIYVPVRESYTAVLP
uniref:(northern house mosquito) hypothetical protein n=1 Tax=Culex pipiens TaxID=7175 RepID=A0A8D8D467_CULPI